LPEQVRSSQRGRRMGIKQRIDALWAALLREHTSPGRVAWAVWLGIVVGFTPFFGLHLLVCVALAWLFGLNKLIVYAAANISIPPLAPILGYISVQLGTRVLEGRWPGLDLSVFRGRPLAENARVFFQAWVVGGVLAGALAGVPIAAVAYVMSQRRPDAFSAILKRASARYRGLEPKYRFYAYLKYRLDPVYRALSEAIPERTHTVDFGAGLNMLAVTLREAGGERTVTGVEWDLDKVAAAKKAAPELTILHGDVRNPPALPEADVVTIVDMLHYFPRSEITAIVKEARKLLRKDGMLLVREGDLERGGSKWTHFVERSAVKLGWNQAPNVAFVTRAELSELLEELGFSVETRSVSGPLHPGNVLYVCRPHLQATGP
jgi:uncharacterized protein (DUF2062 family)/2-polyprenyl-3-methyl-5-hydroxy-6-metoxy-1,4-benzoquinol methylase